MSEGRGSPRPVLSGGRRRRRRRPSLAIAGGILVAIVAVIGVATLDSVTDRGTSSPERVIGGSTTGAGATTAADIAALRRHRGGGAESRFAIDMRRPDVVRLRFRRRPRAGLLFDVHSGRVLWRWKPTRRLAIASLTKMMTALLVVEREDPHTRVRVSRQAVRTAGSAVGVLPKGKKVQLEALMNGLLLVSGNDAAVALAVHTAGGLGRFVHLMNRRADELGLSCTHFSSPHGLQDKGNHSCAADLAVLARADLGKRRIRRITRRQRAIVKFPIKGGRLFLYNNNPLIRAGYPGVTGLKTGYTDRAGRSIVATARRGGIELGVVLLHSYSPGEQATRLLNRGFKTLRSGM
jgi:serine-type D-Ala-D-Ala carboxypeptidase (penicillin-binding protein 5/6)